MNYQPTELEYWALLGRVREVRAAIDQGCDVNERGAFGHTALCAAAVNNKVDVAKVLLDAGADPHMIDDFGKDAMAYAIERGSRDMEQLLNAYIANDLSRYSIHSISFDLTACVLTEEDENRRAWISSSHVAHTVQFRAEAIEWPFDPLNLEDARRFYREQSAENGGEMISFASIRVLDRDTFYGFFKYRHPSIDLAMSYLGVLWLTLDNCWYQINVEAFEHGTAGVREAVVMTMGEGQWHNSQPSDTVQVQPSDDERYDSLFVEHPLSHVRTRLKEIISSVSIAIPSRKLR